MEPVTQEAVAVQPVTIYKQKQDKQPDGTTLIYFQRKKVPDDKLYRCCFVPEWQDEQYKQIATLPGVFAFAVRDAIRVAAGSLLRKHCDSDTENEPKTINPEMLTFPLVVAEMEATQTSEKIDSKQIAAWYDASTTKKERLAAYLPEGVTPESNVSTLTEKQVAEVKKANDKAALLRDKYMSLASNNSGIPAPLAAKMLAYINEADIEHPIGAAVVSRLGRIQQTAVRDDEL